MARGSTYFHALLETQKPKFKPCHIWEILASHQAEGRQATKAALGQAPTSTSFHQA